MRKTSNFILITLILLSFPNILAKDNNFLHFDLKNDCPNPKISSLGILISLSESDDSSYENTLTPEERESYEEIIQLKRSFSSTMSYIPQSFSPEKEKYWEELDYLLLVFVIIAMFPIVFIVFYLFMRFVLKKCTGPRKLKQVTKNYRNITWAIVIVSSLGTIVLFSIVLGKSRSVSDNVNNAFNFAVETISKSDNAFTEINKAVIFFNESNPVYPLPTTDYMTAFKNDINKYIENTKQRTQQILDDESKRGSINSAIYAVYFIVIFAAYLFFFNKMEILELLVSIILFFAVPGLLILEGYNAKFFFYYSDICDSVHGALYSNEFPVADQSLGYYYNCFPTNTKASLYNIRYRLYENLNDNQTLIYEYNNVTENTFDRFFNCEIVNSVLPKIERDFCKESLDYMYSIVSLLTWTLLTGLALAIGSRRLQVLIWKKKMEIEEMIENKEAIF
jgi:hypothetical protein